MRSMGRIVMDGEEKHTLLVEVMRARKEEQQEWHVSDVLCCLLALLLLPFILV